MREELASLWPKPAPAPGPAPPAAAAAEAAAAAAESVPAPNIWPYAGCICVCEAAANSKLLSALLVSRSTFSRRAAPPRGFLAALGLPSGLAAVVALVLAAPAEAVEAVEAAEAEVERVGSAALAAEKAVAEVGADPALASAEFGAGAVNDPGTGAAPGVGRAFLGATAGRARDEAPPDSTTYQEGDSLSTAATRACRMSDARSCCRTKAENELRIWSRFARPLRLLRLSSLNIS